MVNESILEETRGLRKDVRDLRAELAESKGVVKRLRFLTIAVSIIFASFGLFVAEEVYEDHAEDKQQCMNANESREFQYKVWLFVLGQELTDTSSKQNDIEAEMSRTILPAMKKGWRARDCDDLDKPYQIEMPPTPPGVPEELLWGTE